MYQLDFEDFDPTEFEDFCFELLRGLPGFHNVDWRKGTPKSTSPADRGRDIAADVDHVDVDGARHVERWFVDCKHYERGVPPEALQGLLAWAQAERPDVAIVVASGFLSNAAKDYISDFEQNNRPPFRIKYWERPTIDKLARSNREILERFFLSGTPFAPTDAEHIAQCKLSNSAEISPASPADREDEARPRGTLLRRGCVWAASACRAISACSCAVATSLRVSASSSRDDVTMAGSAKASENVATASRRVPIAVQSQSPIAAEG